MMVWMDKQSCRPSSAARKLSPGTVKVVVAPCAASWSIRILPPCRIAMLSGSGAWNFCGVKTNSSVPTLTLGSRFDSLQLAAGAGVFLKDDLGGLGPDEGHWAGVV